MSVSIKIVETKAQLKAFVKFPLELYKDCPYYIPNIYVDDMSALDMAKNPMGKYCKTRKFLAYKDGQLVGRCIAIINEIANRDWNHAEVRFGWMDFIDDKEVSKALIESVIAFGKEYGMTQISGPLGFTDFDSEGCVVEGFDDISSFALKYNYPYYAEHFEALGMAKANDWLEYRIFIPEQLPEKVSRASKLVADRYELHVRKITRKDVYKEGYGQKVFDLVNRTYSELFDFTVLPPEVIDSYVKIYLGLLDLKFVTLIENKEGKLVGMAVCMPSLAHAVKKSNGYLFPLGWYRLLKSMYLKYEEVIELLLIAVDPEYQNRGVHAMIFQEMLDTLVKGGFKYAESNAEMETNVSVQNIWKDYQKELKRRRRVFSKEI
ncbi:MAG: GNAT family N-acetyltransferase [Bacteroidales bacterium]|nr:GNAT family N-acetyltransferase [Bacteroidales bacterium]